MIDFLAIVLIIATTATLFFSFYRLGRANGYLDGQMDCIDRLQQPTFSEEWAKREVLAGRIPLD